MRHGTALVEAITVEDRYRRDLGDLGPLADSIEANGLLHPVVITSDMRLIAGQRRLEAVRKLGRREVDVRIADDLDSAAALLIAERDENTCRKDMTASELYGLGKALEDLERPGAEERMKAGTPVHDGAQGRKTREVVGDSLGLSGFQYQRLKHIGDRAGEGDEDAAAVMGKIDEGKVTVSKGYKILRESDKLRDEDEDRTRLSFEERAEQIRELASTGHVSAQIANKIGIGAERVRALAREADITLPDAAIGKRRKADPNRIVRETVAAAEGAAFGLDLIAFEELDHSQIEEWTSSLSHSIRALNRLNKQLKELVS